MNDAIPPTLVAGQPARFRGGRATAQLQRRGRASCTSRSRRSAGRSRAWRTSSGATLFLRGTRHVQIAPDGQHAAARASSPGWPSSTPACSRSAARAAGAASASPPSRRSARSGCCRASRPSSAQHPDIDIRVSAARRAGRPRRSRARPRAALHAAPGRRRPTACDLFDETLTPVVSRGLAASSIRQGEAPPLDEPCRPGAAHPRRGGRRPRPSTEFLSWRHWLAAQGQPGLQPRRWLYLNFTYQQVQAALAGHGIALARVPLVFEAMQRGELVEPFGAAGRIGSPYLVLDDRRAGEPWPARRSMSSAPGCERRSGGDARRGRSGDVGRARPERRGTRQRTPRSVTMKASGDVVRAGQRTRRRRSPRTPTPRRSR